VDAHIFTIHAKKKFEPMFSPRKMKETVFWDRRGVMMVKFIQQGTTITSKVYCKTLHETV
jgi:hypothetical protein